jgi:hypothetical protein
MNSFLRMADAEALFDGVADRLDGTLILRLRRTAVNGMTNR